MSSTSAAFSLSFPRGILIGWSAGFVNIAKINNIHNAMESGMLIAEATFDVVAFEVIPEDALADINACGTSLHKSWVPDGLYEVRNERPSFNTSLWRP